MCFPIPPLQNPNYANSSSTKITNNCKAKNSTLPAVKKQWMIMNQTGSFITSVAAVKAASTCKLRQFLPDRRIVHVIMELGGNCSFTLSIGNNKGSGLPQLKNSNPQGCVMAPLLFNIYISDLANTTSTKYTYTNNPTIMHANGD